MKRIKYILAAGLLLAGLGGAMYGGETHGLSLASVCPPCEIRGAAVADGPIDDTPQTRPGVAEGPIDDTPEGRPGLAEGPTDDIPPTRPGVQMSDPGLLAEGDVETDGWNLKEAKKV